MKRLKRSLSPVMLVSLMLLLTSCGASQKFYLIQEKDIYYNGHDVCMSTQYMQKVLDAKIEKVK